MRFGKKSVWICMAMVTVLFVGVCSLPPVKIEWHKARLKHAKADRVRLLRYTPELTLLEKLKKGLTGKIISLAELNHRVQRHEDALVRLGFLRREEYTVVEQEPLRTQLKEAMQDMQQECPWYSAELRTGSNLVVTTCREELAKWHQKAKALGIRTR
jgi:hypothetical protein